MLQPPQSDNPRNYDNNDEGWYVLFHDGNKIKT